MSESQMVFAVIVVLLGAALGTFASWLARRQKAADPRSAEGTDKVLTRLDRIEKRLGNLETIVIERDRIEILHKL